MTDSRWDNITKAMDEYTEMARSVRRPLYKRRQLQAAKAEALLDAILEYTTDPQQGEGSDEEYKRGVRAALEAVEATGPNTKRAKCIEVIKSLLGGENESTVTDEGQL